MDGAGLQSGPRHARQGDLRAGRHSRRAGAGGGGACTGGSPTGDFHTCPSRRIPLPEAFPGFTHLLCPGGLSTLPQGCVLPGPLTGSSSESSLPPSGCQDSIIPHRCLLQGPRAVEGPICLAALRLHRAGHRVTTQAWAGAGRLNPLVLRGYSVRRMPLGPNHQGQRLGASSGHHCHVTS